MWSPKIGIRWNFLSLDWMLFPFLIQWWYFSIDYRIPVLDWMVNCKPYSLLWLSSLISSQRTQQELSLLIEAIAWLSEVNFGKR
jgi:hypothetical protein